MMFRLWTDGELANQGLPVAAEGILQCYAKSEVPQVPKMRRQGGEDMGRGVPLPI